MDYWGIRYHDRYGGDLVYGQPLFATPSMAERYFYKTFTARDRLDLKVDVTTWREREAHCLNEDIYQHPIWSSHLDEIPDHYAHVALDDPTMIAFTASPEHGEADRQTRMKPGRYLQRFYPNLTPKQVAFYADWWRTGSKPLAVPDHGELLFATTELEMIRVYAYGPGSCMLGEDCVRVYAAGDLALAYFQVGKAVMARALCWPAKKVFGRVYPTPDAWDEYDDQVPEYDSEDDAEAWQQALFNKLKAEGYTHVAEGGSFNGARIQAIPYDGYDDDEWVMPYLDLSYRLNFHGNHFTLHSHGDWSSTETGGTMTGPQHTSNTTECDHCGGEVDNDETYIIYAGNGQYKSWCPLCREDHTFFCYGRHENVSNDLQCIEVGAVEYCAEEAEKRAFYCEHDDTWYPLDQQSQVLPGFPRSYEPTINLEIAA